MQTNRKYDYLFLAMLLSSTAIISATGESATTDTFQESQPKNKICNYYLSSEKAVADAFQKGAQAIHDATLKLTGERVNLKNFIVDNRVRFTLATAIALRMYAAYKAAVPGTLNKLKKLLIGDTASNVALLVAALMSLRKANLADLSASLSSTTQELADAALTAASPQEDVLTQENDDPLEGGNTQDVA